MKNKQKIVKGMMYSTLLLSAVVATETFNNNLIEAHAETKMTGTEYVLTHWSNYPKLNSTNFDGGWGVKNDVLYTSKNIHWTGFYNADDLEATDKTFEMDLRLSTSHQDPFGWTFRHNLIGVNTYSFYAVEISPNHNELTLAKINSWTPSLSDPVHAGPLYHGTIGAADGSYANYGGGDRQAENIKNVDGEVLAFAKINWTYVNWHKLKIENIGNNIKVWYDGKQLIDYTDNDNPLTSGGYGPYTASQYYAEYKNIYMDGASFLNVPPTTTVEASIEEGAVVNAGDKIRISGTTVDMDKTGTVNTLYKFDNGESTPIPTSSNGTFEGEITIPEDLGYGEHTLYVYGKDSGNGESQKYAIKFFVPDTKAPIAESTKTKVDGQGNEYQIDFNATDNESGVKRIQLPNGNWVNGSSVKFTVNKNGDYTFYVEDNDGNIASVVVNVDDLDVKQKYMVKVIGTFNTTTLDVRVPAVTSFLYNPNTEELLAEKLNIESATNAPIYMKLSDIQVSSESVWKPTLVAPDKYTAEAWKNLTHNTSMSEVALGFQLNSENGWLRGQDVDELWSSELAEAYNLGYIKNKGIIEWQPIVKSGNSLDTNSILTANYLYEFGL